MYVCPNCKSDLSAYHCNSCGFEAQSVDGLPSFFTGTAISNRYKQIGEFYDNLYGTTEDVWDKVAGRGPEFLKFVSSIVIQKHRARYLDIGCGEGYLLAAVTAPEKHGLDISSKALKAAASRSRAALCIGFGEQLPYPDGYFDAITSIGVMTHLIDDLAATREIYRVLSLEGRYVAGVYLQPRLTESIAAKILEYAYPRPRPLAFLNWAVQKVTRTAPCRFERHDRPQAEQPIGRLYTAEQLERVFEQAGLVLEELITKIKRPTAPLPGQHFRIYVLRKI